MLMGNKLLEIKVFFYQIFLAFIFYMISRWLFLYFNSDIIKIENIYEILRLSYYGLKFDLAAIIYLQSVFILIYFFPLNPGFTRIYNLILKSMYFIGGSFGLGLNFVDFAYYRFNLMRINAKVFEVIENESTKSNLFFHFLYEYIHIFILYLLLMFLWFYAYDLIKNESIKKRHTFFSLVISTLIFLFVIFLSVGGARGGDFKKSTRPITLIHAMENVKNPKHADFILNTPFTFIRTFGKTGFRSKNNFSKDEITKIINPIKKYVKKDLDSLKPNLVIFILESMGREYWGSLNLSNQISNYKGYTPFLDSLSKESLIFTNFFANSRKSIHGMPSILAGIPSFEIAYTSSPFSNQPVESVVSIANNLGYNTSFFHGANNGSMGYLGFSKTLGFDNYYGKDEYNNDDDFDGYWGIWDEPFLNFTKKTIDKKDQPFMATIFTLSSHDPYKVPKKYEGVFDKGFLPMHKVVGYTDYSLKKFFDKSKKESWFDNTIFIFTADHGNQTYYPYYKKIINRFANPLMIYWPKKQLKGISNELGQHMDILPTIADLIGYDKPFRSWGRSLLNYENDDSFVVNYFGAGSYFMMNNKYIVVSNGEKASGFYDSNDYDLENNLIDNLNDEMRELDLKFQVFLQDYMNRIVEGRMIYNEEND